MKHEAIGVMTQARVGFSHTYAAVFNAFRACNLPLKFRCGAFMEQNLSNLFEDALAEDPDYIISCEYDCIFSSEDIESLLAIMRSDASIDAVFAAQPPRHFFGQIMASVRRPDGFCSVVGVQPKPVEADLLKCNAGHFGLTVIRASSLRALPKPYLNGSPGDDGMWVHRDEGGGKIDPDISFWMKAEEAGWNVYLATKVRIGHLVEMIAWPDETYQTHLQNVNDWHKTGRPATIFEDKVNE